MLDNLAVKLSCGLGYAALQGTGERGWQGVSSSEVSRRGLVTVRIDSVSALRPQLAR